MNFSRFSLTLAGLCVLLIGTVLFFPRIMSRSARSQENVEPAILKRTDLPVVNYTPKDEPSEIMARGPEGARQWKRQASFDRRGGKLNERSGYVCDLPLSHGSLDMQTLMARSDAIVTAGIATAEALLSPDRTGVFSQFSASVVEVLKGEVRPGEVITLVRNGGLVRFPSGVLVGRGVCYETMPLVSRTYIFFLKHRPDTKDYHVVTGYELKDGTISALDGIDLTTGTVLQRLRPYDGLEQRQFLSMVKAEGAR